MTQHIISQGKISVAIPWRMGPEQLFLALAGVITWLVIVYVEIGMLNNPLHIRASLAGYCIYILCYLPIATGWARRLPKYWRYILVELQVVVAIPLLTVNHGPVAPILLAIWAAQLPDFFSRFAACLQVFISALLFYFILLVCRQDSAPVVTGLVYWCIQIFGLTSSFARVSEGCARRELEKLNRQLQATRMLLEQSSRQDERVRIARDLHDILGHQLTALNLQLEVLHHKVDDHLRDNVQQLKQLAKSLLENIRRVVRDQRNLLSLDIREAIHALVAKLPGFELIIEGGLHLDSVFLAEQLVLCIQEGISNALRHGKANRVVLAMYQKGVHIRIVLKDNGTGPHEHSNNKKGLGIKGMRERLHKYNASVNLTALPQGAELTILCEAQHD